MAIKRKTRPKARVETEPASRGLDLDKAAAKHKEVEERAAGDLMDLKDGWNYLFLLPPWSDENVIWKEVEQHGRLVCPYRAVGKDCLICNEMTKRAKRDPEFVENNRLKSRAFFNSVKRDNVRKLLSAPQAVIKVLAASSVVFREILEYINDEKVDVSDPHACILVGIKKTGKGLRTRYKVKFGDPVDISKYVTPKVMRTLHDLDAFRFAQPASVKDMRKAIRGAADEDEEDFDEEDLDEEEQEEDIDEDEEREEGSEEGSEEDEVFEEPEEEEEGSEDEEELTEEDEEVEEEEEPEEEEVEEDEDGEEFEEEEEEPEPPPKKKVKPKAAPPKVKPKPATSKPAPKAKLASKVGASVKKKVRR